MEVRKVATALAGAVRYFMASLWDSDPNKGMLIKYLHTLIFTIL